MVDAKDGTTVYPSARPAIEARAPSEEYRIKPVRGRKTERFLQYKTRRVRCPRNRSVARTRRRNDLERGRTEQLHGLRQLPETAGDGKWSVRHRHSAIALADRAADRVSSTRAGAPATGDLVPTGGVRGF